MAKVIEWLATAKGRLWAAFALVVFGLLIGAAAAWSFQDNRYGRKVAELNVVLERERKQANADALNQTSRYRKLEQAALDAILAVVAHAAEERKREEASDLARRAEYLAGTRRLSLAVRACEAGGGGAAEHSAAAGGAGEARAELAPEAAAALDAIVSDGDRGIRDANTCIDAYNVVRDTLNRATSAQ